MKNTVFTFFLPLFLLASITSFSQNTVTSEDLKVLIGEWKGTLTYVDYGTNKPFTMPANLIVKEGKNDYQLVLQINYPKEPNANSRDKISLSKDGTKLNKVDILSREALPNGQTKIITQKMGKDNGKKALINMIYIFSPSELVLRKEVKFDDTEAWLMRNEYKYER